MKFLILALIAINAISASKKHGFTHFFSRLGRKIKKAFHGKHHHHHRAGREMRFADDGYKKHRYNDFTDINKNGYNKKDHRRAIKLLKKLLKKQIKGRQIPQQSPADFVTLESLKVKIDELYESLKNKHQLMSEEMHNLNLDKREVIDTKIDEPSVDSVDGLALHANEARSQAASESEDAQKNEQLGLFVDAGRKYMSQGGDGADLKPIERLSVRKYRIIEGADDA